MYGKEKRLYRKAEKKFPDNASLLFRQAILELTRRDFSAADRIIGEYVSIQKENSASEAKIAASKGIIYRDAGILDKAEEYYRKALSIEPDNPVFMNNLAYLLIDNGRNLNEGLELVKASLALRPDNYNFLHTKGWGLFKINQYEEALETLQKSWDLRMKNATYNHEAFIHLEEVRKFVAKNK
jgi:tetratricopeptide (TPR) repeat protein